MTKKKSIADYQWKIKSDKNMTHRIDPVIYYGLTHGNGVQHEYDYQIQDHITNCPEFMQNFDNIPSYGRRILFTAAPGTGKSRLFLSLLVPDNDTYLLIVEPSICICNQVYHDPELKQQAVVINSTTHEHVESYLHKYVITAELCEAIAKEIRFKNPNAKIWFVIDEAHEILSDLAGFRNAATTNVMNSIATMGPQDKVFYVSATPEVLEDLDVDTVVRIHSARPICSGSFDVRPVSVTNARIAWVKTYAKEISRVIDDYNRPVFVFINDTKIMEKLRMLLLMNGYTVTNSTANNRWVAEYVETHGYLPAYTTEFDNARKLDVILTTSVILSGLSIHENPCLGERQYIPCMISTKPDRFNISQMIQFFTRTRYNVPAITLIKKSCRRKDGKDPKAISKNAINAIIHQLAAPYIQGSYHSSGYAYNEQLAGTESFLDETDHLTEDLTYFDRQQNRLVMDEFAANNCAWNNYNSRLYVDTNLASLVEAAETHLWTTGLKVIPHEYNEKADRITCEEREVLKKREIELKNCQYLIGQDFLQNMDGVQNMDAKTNDESTFYFKRYYRAHLNDIRAIRDLCGVADARRYIEAISCGVSKETKEMKHRLLQKGISENIKINGVTVSRVFAAKNFKTEQLKPAEAVILQTVKNTEEGQTAMEAMDTGFTLEQIQNTFNLTKTVHESKIILKAKTFAKAYMEGLQTNVVSRMGSEIKTVLDRVIPDIRTFHEMVLDCNMLDHLIESLKAETKWRHTKKYEMKHLKRLLNSLFNVTEMESGSVLISAAM